MITLSNLRTEQEGEWTRLICDFTWDSDTSNPFTEKTIWFSVKNENADFFSTKVYDPFLLVPYYVAMRYGQDLKICGKVSAKLYHNLTNYIQQIFLDFSDDLRTVKLEVDGFDTVEQDGTLVGAGISCGVDSLSTIYDNYVNKEASKYRINALFLFNCGTHGYFNDDYAEPLFQARYDMNKEAANELNLPIYQVESNIQFFAKKVGQSRVGFLAIWSCIISMQKKIRRYYVSGCLSYCEVIKWHEHYHDKDMDGFCGMYLVPLIQTERIELIYDGAQYRRTEKIIRISDWSIAQRHLNVCLTEKNTAENCTLCEKCLRTVFVIDVIGKLDEFSQVFDLNRYKHVRLNYICRLLCDYKHDSFAKDNIDLAEKYHVKLPPTWFAYIYMTPHFIIRKTKALIKRLIGEERAKQLKQKVRSNHI